MRNGIMAALCENPATPASFGTSTGHEESVSRVGRVRDLSSLVQDRMKRIATWVFYGVGALAIGYLALYAYPVFTGRDLQPGDPIHIFRKPDAPKYS